jgi:hypothetical protein
VFSFIRYTPIFWYRQWESKLCRVEQQQWDSKVSATPTAYTAVASTSSTRRPCLLDVGGSTLIRLLNSALSAGSGLSTSTRCSWKPTGPMATPGERQQSPRVRRAFVRVAGPAGRTFSSAASARGRVSGAGHTAIARTTRSHNESFALGLEKVACSRRENSTEIVNGGALALSRYVDDFEMVTRLMLLVSAALHNLSNVMWRCSALRPLISGYLCHE